MTLPAQVLVRDVTLRDGLQDEAPIPTEAKVALFQALVDAGLVEVELTSFVRADRVPALADAEAMCTATAASDTVRWGLVLNVRGAQRALAAGLRHLQFVVSASEAHNLNNAGRTVEASMAELCSIVDLARGSDAVVEVTVATAFGCPFDGAVPVRDVCDVADRAVEAGVASVGLADTIGTAVPTEVGALVARITGAHPDTAVGAHLHDTRGLAIANAFAAIEAGAVRIDGSVGGLGGCPFAPGASGNLPLEDLVHALENMGVHTGVEVDRLLRASRLACELVGREVNSHVGIAGPRFAGLEPDRDASARAEDHQPDRNDATTR